MIGMNHATVYFYTCEYCGKEYTTENFDDSEFCSMECFHESEEKQLAILEEYLLIDHGLL